MPVTPQSVIREDIRALTAYGVQPSAGFVKLDAMENPFPLPDWLREKIGAVVQQAALNRYPEPDAARLRALLRKVMDVPAGFELLLGNGSDEIIAMIINAVAGPGAVIMAPTPAFVMYRMSTIIARARWVGVPVRDDFSLDVPAMLDAMREHKPAAVFIAYPNNPTGNLFDEAAIARVVDAAPGLVVIDEAYQPFAGRTLMPRLADFPNLLVLRTVSKLGLAGIRLGVVAGRPEWIREIDKVRGPYNINVLTQLVAETVLQHPEVLDEQAATIRAERARLEAECAALPGVTVFPSAANFLLLRVPDAQRVFEGLRDRGVLVKSLHGPLPLLDQCVRFTVGTPDENAVLMRAFRQTLGLA